MHSGSTLVLLSLWQTRPWREGGPTKNRLVRQGPSISTKLFVPANVSAGDRHACPLHHPPRLESNLKFRGEQL